MLAIAIKGPTIALAKEQMQQAKTLGNLAELRFDLFIEKDFNQIAELIKDYPLPLIFTLKEEDQYLLALKPAYCDQKLGSKVSVPKGTKLILSYHCFENTSYDLNDLLFKMQKTPADYYKIALMGSSSIDALKMLVFLQNAPKNVIGIIMGEKGSFLRTFPAPITYASLSDELKTAPGQLTAVELKGIYHYPSSAHQNFGLIGSPVTMSISHITHNRVMQEFSLSSRYVKMDILPEEVEQCLFLAKKAGMLGLSVTMPLKEKVLSFVNVDPIAQKIGAVNTLVLDKEGYRGFNTDGIGALNALEHHLKVKDKRIAILGAGGAAKAIAYEAKNRGAKVLVVNRTESKAHDLAIQLGIQGGGYAKLQSPFEVLINATASIDPIDPIAIPSHILVMDIHNRPKWTPFLLSAKERGCSIVFGYEMFIYQAVEQYRLWFPKIDVAAIKELLKKTTEEALTYKAE